MSFFDILERLRQKPLRTRKIIAFAFAAAVAVAMAIVQVVLR